MRLSLVLGTIVASVLFFVAISAAPAQPKHENTSSEEVGEVNQDQDQENKPLSRVRRQSSYHREHNPRSDLICEKKIC